MFIFLPLLLTSLLPRDEPVGIQWNIKHHDYKLLVLAVEPKNVVSLELKGLHKLLCFLSIVYSDALFIY